MDGASGLSVTPPWLSTELYPFAHNTFEWKGERVHYLDEGEGSPILFVHGTPAWSFEWRHVISAMRKSRRCVAPDLVGFGLSSRPGETSYSIRRHAEMVNDLVRSLDLCNITLVAHDFGGSIALDMAGKHPDRVDKIVLMNSWCLDPGKHGDFKNKLWILKSPLLPFLYLRLNFSAKYLLPRAFSKGRKPSKSVLSHYTAPFPDANSRAATLAFARTLLREGDFFSEVREGLDTLRNKPVTLIWGDNDPLLPSSLVEDWKFLWPGLKVRHCGAGHFVAEEMPEVVIEALRE